ncbi:MAG: cytochrome P450 [Methylobacteriaceae bacterium]|nr:cytochrome P450 [Methylobacteriaceae bacterium]
MTNIDAASQSGNAPVGKEPVVRPGSGLLAKVLQVAVFDHGEILFSLLRAIWPIATFKIKGQPAALVTRYDDVKEIFLADDAFPVSYATKLHTVTGNPFIFGMKDGPDYRHDHAAMRTVILHEDIEARLAPATRAVAERAIAAVNGRIDSVDFVRQVTFEVLLQYFGVPSPANGDIEVWSTRLFQYICQVGDDPELDKEAEVYGNRLRAHVQEVVNARKNSGKDRDDVLGRCLKRQAAAEDGFTSEWISTALVGLIVAGLPQPPAVLPKALEQLLRRSKVLAEAQHAARNGDEDTVRRYMLEAMRFDALTPFLPRNTTKEHVIASGSGRAKTIHANTHVLFSFASAMMDDRRVASPKSFNPDRPATDYMLFGYGLHQCFAKAINEKILPIMLMALLKQSNLARAPGAEGRLTKQGAMAERLVVCFDPHEQPREIAQDSSAAVHFSS